MSNDEELSYRRMYLGQFEISDKDKYLHDIAEEYHARTEAYDRIVCTGMSDNEAMPANIHEFILINRNASSIKKQLNDRASRYGIDRIEVTRAISNHHGKLR